VVRNASPVRPTDLENATLANATLVISSTPERRACVCFCLFLCFCPVWYLWQYFTRLSV